jgi:hypothetical protein
MNSKKDHAKGASKSLNITISAIMEFRGDEGERPNRELRAFLYEKIGDLTESWYRKGFNRGHIQSREAYEKIGKVPKMLTYECSREVSPTQEREIFFKIDVQKAEESKIGARMNLF